MNQCSIVGEQIHHAVVLVTAQPNRLTLAGIAADSLELAIMLNKIITLVNYLSFNIARPHNRRDVVPITRKPKARVGRPVGSDRDANMARILDSALSS